MVRDYLTTALDDLDYDFEVGEALPIRGYGGQKKRAEIRVKTATRYDIGFARNGRGYEILADWYGIKGISQKGFRAQVTQRYAYVAARSKLEEQGFSLVSEEAQAGGGTRMVLRRMV